MKVYYIILLVVTAGVCLAEEESASERNKFVLYNGGKSTVYKLSDCKKILKDNEFSNTKKTVLYIHGRHENVTDDHIQFIVNAYRLKGGYNIIALDWAKDASGGLYFLSIIPKMKQLATLVADRLLEMVAGGLDINKLHLVGFSIGAHMAGRIGSEMKKKSNDAVVVKRITGLDPAGLGFGPAETRLTSKDAEFVDIIHTDAWNAGTIYSTGHVDFWPNNGLAWQQPGCSGIINRNIEDNRLLDITCGHRRAWEYWRESVTTEADETRFNAVTAKNWLEFQNGKTGELNPSAVMGLDCPKTLRGDHYLQTNPKSPFARGVAGTKYDSTIV